MHVIYPSLRPLLSDENKFDGFKFLRTLKLPYVSLEYLKLEYIYIYSNIVYP